MCVNNSEGRLTLSYMEGSIKTDPPPPPPSSAGSELRLWQLSPWHGGSMLGRVGARTALVLVRSPPHPLDSSSLPNGSS